MKNNPYSQRLKRCCQLMKENGIDVLLLTKPANMFYLTGDGRLCAFAMVSREGKVALGVPSTDVEDVTRLATFDQIAGFEDEVGMIHSIAHVFKDFGVAEGTVGLEYTFLRHTMVGMLTHPHAKPEKVVAKDCTPIMTALRLVKEPEEIERIKAAGVVTAAGMRAAVEAVKPGATEIQVAAAADYAMRLAGAEDLYKTYVSSGSRTSIAHGLPTKRTIQVDDLVMIDLHPVVDGYSADICRTICAGKPSPEQKAAYDLYLKALQAAIAKAKAGVNMVELEDTLHGILKSAGHEKHIFGPTTHGIGIEFEEAPLPPGHAFFHGEKESPPLAANTAIAIGNCGLYLGPWGVRIEDTLVVGQDGPMVLTDFPYELEKLL